MLQTPALDARVKHAHDEAERVALILGRRSPQRTLRSPNRLAIRRRNTSDDFSFASGDFKVLGAFFVNG
jgi:hypothetical protein